MPVGKEEVWLAQYEQTLTHIYHEDLRRWTLFGVFAAVQGFLIQAASPGFTHPGVALIGILTSFTAVVVIHRNHAYLVDRTNIAIGLQELLFDPPEGPDARRILMFYDEDGRIPIERIAFEREDGQGNVNKSRLAVVKRAIHEFFGYDLHAWTLMRALILVAIPLWTATLVSGVRQTFPTALDWDWTLGGIVFNWQYTIGSTAAAVIVALALRDGFRQRKKRLLKENDIVATPKTD